MKLVPISTFKKMTAQEIREGPCVEVVSDGEHLFYAIVGTEAEMRVQIASQASMIDASRGKPDLPQTITFNTDNTEAVSQN